MAGLFDTSSVAVSLESLESGNTSFYTADSLFPTLGTPTDTGSMVSEDIYDSQGFIRSSQSSRGSIIYSGSLISTSLESFASESSDSSAHTMRATTRKSGVPWGSNSQRLGSQSDLNGRSSRIIVVMGPSGSGKSAFIKAATGSDDIRVGHSLCSCTQEIYAVRCQHPSEDHDIILVDTPSLDDTFRSGLAILGQIANWLRDAYQAGSELSGILYLHCITTNRMTNTAVRHLNTFQNLCGSETLSSTILVTTHWDDDHMHEGRAREGQLYEEYWRPLLSCGSRMLRYEDTHHSAWNIIDSVPKTAIALRIQREMVDEGKKLRDTAAARSLSLLLQWEGQIFQNIIQRLDLLSKGVVDSSSQNDTGTRRVEEDLRESNEDVKEINEQEEQLLTDGSIASSVAAWNLKRGKRKAQPWLG